MSLKAWDTETTITQKFKRKATPFGGINWVVTHGFKSVGEPVQEVRFGAQRPPSGWLRPVLVGTRLLAGFNIKFDLLHALQDSDNLTAWMEFVSAGGNVWDCQLAEYLLEGMDQRQHMLSLDEVAPRYGGDLKFDEVKALWQAGVDTHEIESALLSRYLCGDGVDKGDVENTELIARAQIKRAQACGQLNSILMNMGALLCSTEMERNGMYADKARGLVLAEALKVRIAEFTAAVEAYLPVMPFKFNWNSPKQKSALIFGGTVQWDAYEYDLADGSTMLKHEWEASAMQGNEYGHKAQPPRAYYQKDETHYVLQDGSTMECLWWEHCLNTEWRGDVPDAKEQVRYASGKNAGEPKTKKVKVPDYTKPKGRTVKAPHTFDGFTYPEKKWQGAEEGVYSTSAEVIEELGVRNIPFLKAMATMQKLSKDLGTYYITVAEDGTETGMLSLVDEHGIIHHKINHTSTVTGRFSSSDPNLQNIPKGNKSDVKTLFVSRWGEDGVITQSDFSSLEIYVQAILTRCEQLIADLRAGLDMHVKRLALKEGKPYDEVYVLCKGDKSRGIEPDSEWDYKRTGAKVFSFQRAYGAGAAKIAASTGMPIEDVLALIAAEEAEYPEIPEHFIKRTEQIKANRKPAGIVIPHPTVPGVTCNLGRSFVRTPDGKLYSYIESPSPDYLCKKGIFASFSPTEIKNYEVQGTGGEWMKAAMWLMVRAWYARKNFDGFSLLVNTVHDAAYTDSHKRVALEAAALLHACMEAASDFMAYWFNWDIPLPVPSDTTWGASMMEEKPVPGVKELAAPLREQLRSRYMGGFKPAYLH